MAVVACLLVGCGTQQVSGNPEVSGSDPVIATSPDAGASSTTTDPRREGAPAGTPAGSTTPDSRAVTPADPEVSLPEVLPRIVATHPHDASAFTQGLVVSNGTLFESTGGYGESALREVDVETGAVQREVRLADDRFGEGLAAVGDLLVQLTWQAELAFVYDAGTFEVVDEHRYEGEGWGLCHDGSDLWMSDGSAALTRRDPHSFDPTGSVAVTRDGVAVERLNELECANGLIYANVWLTDEIVVIEPDTGAVVAVIDGSALLDPDAAAELDSGAVLNGIAHDPSDGTFLLTGKLWPRLFRVEIPDPG